MYMAPQAVKDVCGMLFAYYRLEQKIAIKDTYRLYTLCAEMYTSEVYNESLK